MALDAWSMDREVWEATYMKPKAKPTGGPFTFDKSTTMRDVKDQLATQGFTLERSRVYAVDSDRRKGLMILKEGRAYKKLIKLMEASADSMRKGRDHNGWDAFTFDFGGKKITVGKTYFVYPINGNKWSVWES